MASLDGSVLDFLQEAPSIAELGQLVKKFGDVIGRFGYETFGYVRLATPGEPVSPNVVFGQPVSGWGEHYVRERLARHDPTLQLVFSQHSPFAWRDIDEATLTKEQKRLFDEAFKFGLKNGFVVPVAGPLGEVGAVVLVGSNAQSPSARDRGAIQALATVFATCGRSLVELASDEPIAGTSITRREAQCLSWVAQGKTDWEIAVILAIAPRTVGAHLDNVRAKLGAATRAQAVVEAWRHGLLIEPNLAANYGKRPIH